jgi:hypothetical protein
MNKNIFTATLVFFVCLVCPLLAQTGTLEFRTGAFFPARKDFRKIYGNAGADYQIQASMGFCSCIDLWAQVDFYPKRGRIKGCGSSKIDIVNFSLGPRYVFPLSNCINAYAGAGLVAGYSRIRNRIFCSRNKESTGSVGGVVKSGINIYLNCHIFLDLFVDYSYVRAYFHRRVNVGGLTTGAGIGYRF